MLTGRKRFFPPLFDSRVVNVFCFFFPPKCVCLLAGSLVEDIGEMILQLRRQVESLFTIKYGKTPAATELNPLIHTRAGR